MKVRRSRPLEFLTTVKGSTCEQITTEVGSGQTKGAEAAAKYDEDCKKSAVQQRALYWKSMTDAAGKITTGRAKGSLKA